MITQNRRWPILATLCIVVVIVVIYGLNRGIFVGSTSFAANGLVYERCHYLFITGVIELPARGGPLDQPHVEGMPIISVPDAAQLRGTRLPFAPDDLYCRIFAE